MQVITKKLIFELDNPPTPVCHASTIAFYNDNLYSAWFGGTGEGHTDVGIWLSTKNKNGESWSAPAIISSSKEIPHWNPVLFSFDNKLFLYYKKGFKIPEWQTFYRILENGIWSEEKELVPGDKGGRGPVKNKPIILKNGFIIAGASLEKPKWNAFIDISSEGVNWQAQKLISADVSLIQPTIWETNAGIHALMRSDAGFVYRTDSTDGGINWSKAYKTALPNNNSGIDAVYTGGNLFVVYNPVNQNWGARTPLVISKSDDNGITWCETVTLEDAEGEYSYPAVIEADGFLHIVYTYKRKSIMYIKMSI